MFFRKAVWLRVICCLACFGVVLSTGCRNTWPFKQARVASQPSPEAKKQYNLAVAAYMDQQYRLAADRFETIRQQTPDKRFALMALYGAACSQLMAANTPQEYNDALVLWDKWVKHVPGPCEYEDSSLFDPLIKNKMIFSNIPMTPEKSGDMDIDTTVPRWLLIKSKEELDRLKAQLDMAQQNLEKRQKKIQALEKEIGELKGQIKALETIDQKIQKKKNAIPSTDSAPSGDIK
jgi:TolA-binding protein